MPRNRERRYVSKKIVDHVKPMVMRMLDAFEDVPGYVPLKNILLRTFLVDSRETADTIQRVYRLINPPVPHDCVNFLLFEEMLGHMTPEEKARHLASLLDMFKGLMTRHQRRSSSSLNNLINCDLQERAATRFLTLQVEVLRGVEGTSGELVRFVEYVVGTMPIELRTWLLCMDMNVVDYLLTCFSDVRFHASGIRDTDFLMDVMPRNKNMLSVVLIRNGFKYSFNQVYYEFCFFANIDNSPRESGMIRDMRFVDLFTNSGNLRMQMAAEILVPLLCKSKYGIKRELICTLWESLPDPFITPDELYHLMEPFFEQGSPVLVGACARYRELFPGVPLVKQPRSLKHLARVRIRESMVRAHTIGERAVRSLGLPEAIQDYLWKLEAI